jgi:hypothetical protein
LVVVTRHAKVRHERQHLAVEVPKTEPQVHRGRWWRPTAFCLCARGGAHGNWVGIKARLYDGFIARRKGQKLRRRRNYSGPSIVARPGAFS